MYKLIVSTSAFAFVIASELALAAGYAGPAGWVVLGFDTALDLYSLSLC